MKRIFLILCMLIASISSQAQQQLWTSTNSVEVIDKVRDLYNRYQWYYDQTGFDKKDFIKKYDRSDISNLKTPIIIAGKFPTDKGPVVKVEFVTSTTVDVVMFSDVYIPGAKMTFDSDWPKFKSWYSGVLTGTQ